MSLKKVFINSCVLFTILTIFTNIIGLISGQTTDTHIHLISRFVLCLIGMGSINLFKWLQKRNLWKILSFIIHFTVTIGAVMIFIWLTGFIETVHPTGYRDGFLNFTAIYIVVAVIYEVTNLIRNKKLKESQSI